MVNELGEPTNARIIRSLTADYAKSQRLERYLMASLRYALFRPENLAEIVAPMVDTTLQEAFADDTRVR